MNKSFIEKTIEINVTPAKLWRVFTDPAITRQMGGEYVTDWQIGSSFSWKGNDGNIYTNGAILQLEPERILQHNLFNPGEETNVLSVITYQMEKKDAVTVLNAREDYSFELTAKEYEDASAGWDFALAILKETAENSD